MKTPTIFIVCIAALAIMLVTFYQTKEEIKRHSEHQTIYAMIDSVNSPLILLPSTKPVGDDWVLIGDKNGCKLYTKAVGFNRVYWSICYDSNISSSVASN